MELGEFVTGFDAGLFTCLGALDSKGEFVEQGEALLHVLVESGVVQEILPRANSDFVIRVFPNEKAEGLLGAFDLTHGAEGIAHAIGGEGRFMGLRPVVDDRLKAVPQRGLWFLQLHHGVAPHQLGVRSTWAFFIEGEEFLVLGKRDLEVAVKEMLLSNLDLVTFHVAHLLEGCYLNLLHGGECPAAQRGKCHEEK
mgnify:CR=1 FL=1